MIYNNDWLRNKFQDGEQLEFLFFWGHHSSGKGIISKSCLSQWWPAPFKVDEVIYRTAEHWMMATKARLFGDSQTLERIIAAITPGEAKALGRSINNFDATVWDREKFNIVVDGNLHKFSQNKQLGEFLIGTAEKVIVEASPIDTIWGIGMTVGNKKVDNPLLWKGQNLLGYALMEVRDKLEKIIKV